MAILFDLDGTLLNPAGSIAATLEFLMEKHGFASLNPEKERLIGKPLRDILLARTDDLALIETMIHEYRVAFFEVGAHRVRPYDGVPEMLAALPAPMGVVTTKGQDEAIRLLTDLDLAHHFEVIIGDDDKRPVKPDPAPVHAALAALGIRAKDAWMIGDTEFDVRAGRAAGTSTVGVTWGSGSVQSLRAAGAHHVLDSVPALHAFLIDA